jgi:hemoglobin/transferrin/lactoferrin receptor protein
MNPLCYRLQKHRRHQPSALSLCMALAIAASAHSYAEEQPITELAAITVYAQQENNTPASVTKIDRDSLDQTGATDMASIVKYLPLVNAPFSVYGGGTYFDGSGTSSYNIRGVDANRIGLDVDGVEIADASISPYVPPNSMSTRGSGRDYIEPEMFSSIDILSGTTAGSSDGIGGRVSFKNKSPEDYLSADKHYAGSFKNGYVSANNSWFSSVTGAVGNERLKALVAYAHRDGQQAEPNSNTAAFNMDWTSDAALARVFWQLNPQQQLQFTVDYYQKEADTTGMDSTASTSFRGTNNSQNQQIDRTLVSIEHLYRPQGLALFDQLNSKIWHQESNSDVRTIYYTGSYTRDFVNNYQQKSTGLKLDASKHWANHQLKYGLAYEQKDYNSDRYETRSNGATPPFTGSYLSDSKLHKYTVYVSDDIGFSVLGKALVLSPSLRFERQEFRPDGSNFDEISDRNFNNLSPGVSLSYQLTPHNYTYFKYIRGNRVPSPMEIAGSYQTSNDPSYIVVGNANLDEETSDAFEIGLRNTAIKGIRFDLTGFYTKYDDFIDYYNYGSTTDYPYGYYRAENLAQARIWGAELSTRVDLAEFVPQAQGFSVALVAGSTQGSAENKAGNRSDINSVQPAKASLSLSYDDPKQKFGLGFTTTAVDSKTAVADVSTFQDGSEAYQPVAGYTIFDVSGYWNINKFAKLNIAFNNIFDKTYWSYASVGTLTGTNQAILIDRAAETGRNVVASLELKF